MWPEADRWRAPVNDFPPRWANAWGDDQYGLWADLTVNGVTQCMRWIEPGEFVMGSSDDERAALTDKNLREWAYGQESAQHIVEISSGFWLADTPCTQAFWAAITDGNPSRLKGSDENVLLPVESVSWNAVEEFLAQLRRLVPQAYATLPSEAQWEYACRAGAQTAYWWGDNADSTRANMGEAFKQTTHVKHFKPNPWGLFDVHGNVWEWCLDAIRDYEKRLEVDPNGGDFRVVRGGSWAASAGGARSACRYGIRRTDDWSGGGFRLALRSPSPGGGAASR
jgi:formylglycine-generating enzyme